MEVKENGMYALAAYALYFRVYKKGAVKTMKNYQFQGVVKGFFVLYC